VPQDKLHEGSPFAREMLRFAQHDKLGRNFRRGVVATLPKMKCSNHVVSVIIPTYNRGELVAEAVASVLCQQKVQAQLIVVDDGSNDDTLQRLQPYRSSIVYVYQANAGVSAARNAGLRIARGDWIAFLDSDDLWLPQKLARQLEYLAGNRQFMICQTEELWMRQGRRWNPKKYHRKPSGHCFPSLLERCMVSPSAVMVHRAVLAEVGGFDEGLPACEDYDLWLRIGVRHPIGLVPEALVIKRGGHPDQLSATTTALDRYRIRALAKLLRAAPLDAEQHRLALAVLRRKCQVYAQGCIKRGRLEEAAATLSLPDEFAAGSS
jgi:glycosyltransferase involved in cell wall biosynthesis